MLKAVAYIQYILYRPTHSDPSPYITPNEWVLVRFIKTVIFLTY